MAIGSYQKGIRRGIISRRSIPAAAALTLRTRYTTTLGGSEGFVTGDTTGGVEG